MATEAVINPSLIIFKTPPTDLSIDAYRMVTIQPTMAGINPMEFISIDAYRMVTIQPTTTGINPMEFIIPGWTVL